MKFRKRLYTLLCVLALILALPACGNDEGNVQAGGAGSEPSVQTMAERWRVCQVKERSILAFPEREDGTAGELCFVSLENLDETAGKLAPGAVVEVVYDGCVLETWPGQIPGVESVTVVEQGEDFMTLYLNVLDELYETSPGLNPEGSTEASTTYGFDLTGVHNLTEGEKEALAYLFTCTHNTDWEEAMPAGHVLGTFEELVDKGYIDGEKLYWEDGLLFTLEDEPAENGKLTFSAQKWRGGDGAIFYTDCKAKKEDGQWAYELGGFAIS